MLKTMYSLKEIFEQAELNNGSIKSYCGKNSSVVNYGIKIVKYPNSIQILNCHKGGDYYKEITPEQYELIKENGWRKGGMRMQLLNCKHKLEIIEERVREEVNSRKNDKYIQYLKNRREKILIKYNQIKQKLNYGKEEKHL